MRATSGDFNRVMQVVKDQICRALGEKHLSMDMFKVWFKMNFVNTTKDEPLNSGHIKGVVEITGWGEIMVLVLFKSTCRKACQLNFANRRASC